MGEYSIDVKGKIVAEGSHDENIIFQSSSETGWKGISFIDNTDGESTLRNCVIRDVKSSDTSAIYLKKDQSSKAIDLTIVDVVIEENDNEIEGGGVTIIGGNVKIVNSLIVNNSSSLDGGGIYLKDCEAFIINTTIADNSCDGVGGGLAIRNSDVKIYNSIIWGNMAGGEVNQIDLDMGSDLSICNSNVETGFEGITGSGSGENYSGLYMSNIDLDPEFNGVKDRSDYSIAETSPCIDGGSIDVVNFTIPEYDIVGNDRIYPENIDMGAYEYTPSSIGEENLASGVTLYQNYPNPFNPETTISFSLENRSNINLAVYNSNGELVYQISDQQFNSGLNSIKFDGAAFNSGVYFYTLKVEGKMFTRKMLLVK